MYNVYLMKLFSNVIYDYYILLTMLMFNVLCLYIYIYIYIKGV